MSDPPRTPHRAGFVVLVGRPNVGKSTLMNALAGESLAIVTRKPQTTRSRLLAVVNRPDAQVVLVDTPGLHQPVRQLGAYMNLEARTAAADADVLVLVADASEGREGPARESLVLEALHGLGRPVVLALNKVDRIERRAELLPLLQAYSTLMDFAAVVPISASQHDGLDRLLAEVEGRLPEGEPRYPVDTLTDRPERFFVAERIRAAVIEETAQEIPYTTAVEIEEFVEAAPVLRIRAGIHVERHSQKKIVVGTRGARIRAIGVRARQAIEGMLGRKVFLELWVKVTPDWTRSPQALARFGYVAEKKPRGTGGTGPA